MITWYSCIISFKFLDIFLFRINVSMLKFGQGDFTSGWIQPPDKGMWKIITSLFCFFFTLYKQIGVPLSGSAKHMRPIIRSYVWVEVQNMCVSVELHMLFVSQSFTCLVQGCGIIKTHQGVQKSKPETELFLTSFDHIWVLRQMKMTRFRTNI